MSINTVPHIYLAPLQGLTALPFRKAFYKTFGNSIDIAVSPFISLTHGDLSTSIKKLSDVLPEHNVNSIPVIPQILGKEPIQFIQLANTLCDLGYNEINWNLGCPVSRVVRKKRGSGLLPYPNEVEEILSTVTSSIKNKISIKMRLGFENPDEIFKLLPILNKFPLVSVCIHPRIGIQMYEGGLYLNTLTQCLPLLKHKVIFNGDICTKQDYTHIKTQFPSITSFMLGRGILKNPLLPSIIKEQQIENHLLLLQQFEETLAAEIFAIPSVDKSKLNKMKEFWFYLSCSFKNSNEVLQLITQTQTISEYQATVQKIFFNYTLI